MLKVVLRYTDCLQDGRRVFNILAGYGVAILKTRPGWSIYPKITIMVRDYPTLNEVVCELNRNCTYEVRVVKTKQIRSRNESKN